MIKPLLIPASGRHTPAKSAGLLQNSDVNARRLKGARQQDPRDAGPDNNHLLTVHDQSAGGITQKVGRPTLPCTARDTMPSIGQEK